MCRVFERMNGNDLVIVANHLPSKVLQIFWKKERRQWHIRSLDTEVTFWIRDKEYSWNDGSVELGMNEEIKLNDIVILFSAAKQKESLVCFYIFCNE